MKIPDFQNSIPDSIQLNLNRLKTEAGSKEAIAFETLKSPPTECIEGKIKNFLLIDFTTVIKCFITFRQILTWLEMQWIPFALMGISMCSFVHWIALLESHWNGTFI